ncbi:hypothetical protein C4565_04315, partial [Candidatus Parcubacteria bacterium]
FNLVFYNAQEVRTSVVTNKMAEVVANKLSAFRAWRYQDGEVLNGCSRPQAADFLHGTPGVAFVQGNAGKKK